MRDWFNCRGALHYMTLHFFCGVAISGGGGVVESDFSAQTIIPTTCAPALALVWHES